MPAPHDRNQSQQKPLVNGINGFGPVNGENGGDEFPHEQPQPSIPGVTVEVQRQPPDLRILFFRGLLLCRRLLHRLARSFSAQALAYHALDAVYCALCAADHTIHCVSSAASQRQPVMWYIMMPISILLMIVRTGAQLALKYLDIRIPSNQQLVIWLNSLRLRLQPLQESACHVRATHGDVKLSEIYESSHPAVEPVPSSSSSGSSLSPPEDHSSSEEEPARPETPGDKSMYFSVEQLKEEEGEGTEGRVEKMEYTVQIGKAEEETPVAVAEEAGGAAASIEHTQASVPMECSPSTEEAERAAMGALHQAPDQPPSSQDLLAAEGSSHTQPGTSKPEHKHGSKAAKGTLFHNFFGSRLG